MFYKNTDIRSYREALCADEPEDNGWCKTESFRISYFSSNNLQFLKARKGYAICSDNSKYSLFEIKFPNISQRDKRYVSSFFSRPATKYISGGIR